MPPTYRYPPISLSDQPSSTLPYAQKLDEMATSSFGPNSSIITYRDTATGGLIGPFPTLIASKDVGSHLIDTFKAFQTLESIPADAREVAILVAGARFGAEYEQYAHRRIAVKTAGLTKEQVGEIKKGNKPEGLSGQAQAAWDVSWFLANEKGPLPAEIYDSAVGRLGKEGTLLVAHYVGMYCYMSVLMNHSAAPLPEGET